MKTVCALSALVMLQPVLCAAETAAPGRLPNVVVVETDAADPAMSPVALPDDSHALGIDGADIIRSLTGVSAGRFGGHGLEPVIRGQSQGRLNVLLDGATVHGGCPNRMDPPTSFMGAGSYDRVTVLKGVQTLQHGAGGSGGTVLFERTVNPPADGFDGNAGVSASTNGVDSAVFADLTAGSETLFVRGIASRHDAGNYDDGDGRSVRSAYTTTTGALLLGYAPAADTRLELTLESVRTDDALFPGAGMDAPEDEASLVRMRLNLPLSQTVGMRADAWYSAVDHLMNNYSLRERTAPMAMRVPADSDTLGARVLFDVPLPGAWSMTTGLDFSENSRKATRYQGMTDTNVETVNSYLWPDVTIRQTGLIAEALGDHGNRRIRLGGRVDHVSASTDQAMLDPPGMAASANTLYGRYYGSDAGKQREDNIGLLARYEHDLGDGLAWFAGASRTVRTADTTERYIAANNPMNPAARWIGNPWLDPERHHQVDTGLSMARDDWSVTSVVYVDEVSDYILRDRARGQDGVLAADGATVYRNVDARFFGAEVSGDIALAERWTVSGGVSYVHADNRDDDQALAQIPPLNGFVEAGYRAARWTAGARWSWAASQPRVDDDPAVGSGLDAGRTAGHGVLDLHGSLMVGKSGQLRLGVKNLLDKTYADHLNRANQDPFNPDPVQVNEPGRSVWASWRSTF